MNSSLNTAIHQIMFSREGGSVKRCHTVRTLHQQTVAEHSYGVAWLVWKLAGDCPSANLLMAALAHDVPEAEIGDIPSPTKKALGSHVLQNMEDTAMQAHHLPLFDYALTEQERTILRLADMFELAFFCIDEHNLGNRNPRLHTMFDTIMGYLSSVVANSNNELADGLYIWIKSQWRRANEC